MSNILVTGGMGFVGSRLSRELIEEGHNVVLVDNMSYGNYDNAIFGDDNILNSSLCKLYEYDVSNEKQMQEIFNENKFDYVYHFAGIAPLPDCQLNKLKCMESNVTGVLNVLEQCRLHGVKRFMLSSSNAVYENVHVFPVKELEDLQTTLMYPTSKLMAEQICKSFSRTYKVPITIFRFANVYGSGMDILRKYPPVTGAFIKNLWQDKQPTIYSDGLQSRDFIYIEDLLELVMLPMKKAKTDFEIMNVGTGISYTILEQFLLIIGLMNKKIEPKFESHETFWNKMPEIYNGVHKIDPYILKSEVEKYTLMDISYANKTYGWEPKYSFNEGLLETIAGMIKILKEDNYG